MSVNNSAISFNHLTKFYGATRGVEDISFEVFSGEVFGFLGPNGAGKSTAMRVIVGLLNATSGSATILDQNAVSTNTQLRKEIGYLPGALSLYRNLSGYQYLTFLSKMRKQDCEIEFTNLAIRLNIDLTRRISELSKGNRQKIGVIQAFMHKPKVLILDEPTSGLDPVVQRVFEEILVESKNRGAAIMLSSHVLSEVEHLADRVAIIVNGKLKIVESVSVLKERGVRHMDLEFTQPIGLEVFASLAGVSEVQSHGNRIKCKIVGPHTQLLKRAVEMGVLTVNSHEPSLEEIFMDSIGDEK